MNLCIYNDIYTLKNIGMDYGIYIILIAGVNINIVIKKGKHSGKNSGKNKNEKINILPTLWEREPHNGKLLYLMLQKFANIVLFNVALLYLQFMLL